MKKCFVLFLCLFLVLSGCSSKEEGGTSYTCDYGKKGDDFYVKIIVDYDNDVVKKYTFHQYEILELITTTTGSYDDVIEEYDSTMEQIAGIQAHASVDGDYMHYYYSVDMKSYNSSSDPMGIVVEDALDNNGNTNQKKLKKYLESNKMGYSCQ